MWDKEFHLLSEKYRVVRFDLPGFGFSDFTEGNYAYSNIINELLTHLDIKDTHILAASFGGKLAIDFYLENPEKCLSLSLLSPALGGWKGSSFLQKYEEDEERLLQEGKIEETAKLNYKTWILRNRDAELINVDVKQLVVDMQMKFLIKPEAKNSCEEIKNEDHILQLKNIRIPVLIINGEYDVEDFHDISEVMIKEISYVKKNTMPNTAPLANLESPKQFLNLISDFFLDNAN